jgi:hypothetical protein
MSLLHKVKKDENYRKFKRILANSMQVDLEAVYTEVMGMHSARTMRGLKGGDAGARKISKAAAMDQSYRSRCVELNAQVYRELSGLEIAYDAIKGHVVSNYHKYLTGRSQADRNLAFESLPTIRKAKSRMQELRHTQKIVDMIISDLDQAGFTVKHLLDSLTVATKREYIN